MPAINLLQLVQHTGLYILACMSSFPFPVIKFLLLPLTIMTSLTATDWLIDRTSTQLTVCSDWQQQQQQQQTKTLHSFFSPHSGDFDPGTYSHRLTDGTFLRCCSCCWQNGILLLLCPLWMWLAPAAEDTVTITTTSIATTATTDAKQTMYPCLLLLLPC